ncbi:MAG: hypothetical protein ACLTV3_10500 [Faecalibacterium prausnitzii]
MDAAEEVASLDTAEEAIEEAVLLEEEPQAARTPAALTAAMAVINERREIFFMENSFDKSMVLWSWRLVSYNQLQSILSNSLSLVGCYGNGGANLSDGKNGHKNRVRPPGRTLPSQFTI